MNILMPQLGETVAEGKITLWFKAAGDTIKPGDNLFEIETDKVSVEVPAIEGGVLTEIRVQAGEVVPVGVVVGIIGNAAGAPAAGGGEQSARAASPSAAAPAPALAAAASPSISAPPAAQRQPVKLDPFFEVRTPDRNFGPARLSGGATVTPLARRLAGEAGIDLSRLRGTGPHGRIIARDVESAPRPEITAASAPATAGTAAGPLATFAREPSADQIKALYDPAGYAELPLDGMRRTIAARLTQATQTIPHFQISADIEIDRLKSLREEANAAAPRDREGAALFKLSLNDFVVRALALALQRVPAANAIWAGDSILRFRHSDIGVAVALDGGLITPVIRNAEMKTLSAISTEVKELAARAREKKLKPHEYQGGASAVSNLGMYGVRQFSAIINPPHSTILAVGAARRAPSENADGGITFISVMTATLSCDHRVVDGALGAELLAAIKALIETPVNMLV